MSFVVGEAFETFVHKIDATGNIVSAELLYIVSFDQDASELEALEAVRGVAPAYVGLASVQSFEIDEMFDLSHYKVSVEYSDENSSSSSSSQDAKAEEEEPTLSFNCGTSQKHIVKAYSQTQVSGEVAIDTGGLVGWNGLGGDASEVAGVDVPVAELQETYTKTMKMSDLTTSFRRKIASITGCKNEKSFKGWSAGEVLFTGCSFSGIDKKSERVSVSFNFSIKTNEKLVLPNGKTVTLKGWDYFWVMSKARSNKGSIINDIKASFVAQVIRDADFSKLGV